MTTNLTEHRTPLERTVWIVGILLAAFGVVGLLAGGSDFSADPPDGAVNGEMLLGVEANGWTNALFIANGALLIVASGSTFSARFIAAAVGLDLAGAAVVALLDGSDVVGIFAANTATAAVWGALAVSLLFLAARPGGRSPG